MKEALKIEWTTLTKALQQKMLFNKYNDYSKMKELFHLNPNVLLLKTKLPFYKDIPTDLY